MDFNPKKCKDKKKKKATKEGMYHLINAATKKSLSGSDLVELEMMLAMGFEK